MATADATRQVGLCAAQKARFSGSKPPRGDSACSRHTRARSARPVRRVCEAITRGARVTADQNTRQEATGQQQQVGKQQQQASP